MFPLRNLESPLVTFNNQNISLVNSVKYFGLTRAKRLTRSPHVRLKRKTIISRLNLIKSVKKSELSLKLTCRV